MILGSTHRRQQINENDNISRIKQDLSDFQNGAKLWQKQDRMLRTMATRWITRRQPNVCIVGAGAAGLQCADILLEAGVKVTMYEGRGRIGGRIQQETLHGHSVDLGPNWIHGTDHNPILDLAKETKSIACSVDEVSATFDENGDLMKQSRSDHLSELMWSIIADAFKYSNESSDISPNRSLKDYFVEEVSKRGLNQNDTRIVLQMAEIWGGFIGDHVEHQSLRYFWLEECIDGENLFLSSTYKAILARIADRALKEATIHLSKPVLSIDTSNFSSTQPEVSVTAEAGKTESFDAVVLTAPLGCLKRSKPVITPALDSRLLKAVKQISYGRLEKAFVSFDTAFWDRLEPTSKTVDSAAPKPVFRHFLHPLYAESNPHAYDVGMMSLHSLPGGIIHPTLLFYIHGQFATDMINLLTPYEPGSDAYNSALQRLLLPYYSRLPNYDENLPECKPRTLYATSWQRDEFAGFGSYTNFQIPNPPVEEGTDHYPHLDEDIEALRYGSPERGLWLAGEHTAPFIALGTVTGAYWSGNAVGKRIVNWLEGGSIGEAENVGESLKQKTGRVGSDASTVQVGKGGEAGITGVEK